MCWVFFLCWARLELESLRLERAFSCRWNNDLEAQNVLWHCHSLFRTNIHLVNVERLCKKPIISNRNKVATKSLMVPVSNIKQ